MSEQTIDPVIAAKLARFSRGRQRLILWRGISGALAVWLGAMMALALIDRFIVMPDGLRLGLSISGYVAAAVIFWFTCGRHLLNMPGPRELARLIELAAPQLREELLSAVELADSSPEKEWDSKAFRDAVQQTVSTRVGEVRMESLLTRKLISTWLYAAMAVLVVFLLLTCVPGLKFHQFFFRAAFAAANLERPSDIQIKIMAPAPADRIMPEGESVPVTVSVTGGECHKVILEIIPENAPRERIVMNLSGQNLFSSTIQLASAPVKYRVRAMDAITRKYLLEPRPAPQVLRFKKTYRSPAYTRIPPRTVSEVSGDLDGLDGTEVDMDIELNQPVREASLEVETGSVTNWVKIPCANSSRITTKLQLKSGTYKVNLLAAVTLFVNKFSPKYEIRARPDLLPSVKIDLPEQDQLVLSPDSVVNLTGTAKDDLSVTNVEQLTQVNRGPWTTVPLSQADSNEVKVARTWDLFSLGVHPGDHVLTKLVAVDLKGQRGESAPLRIKISNPGFDPKRLKEVMARQDVHKAINELRKNSEQLEHKLNEAKNTSGNNAADPLQKKQDLLSAAVALENTQKQAEEALKKIKETLPDTRAPREAADLALVGSAISRIQREELPEIKEAIKQAIEHTSTNDSRSAQEDLSKVNGQLAKEVTLARVAEEANRQMLSAEEANLVSRDLQQLKEEQNKLAEQLKTAAADDPAKAERLARRQSVAADETKSIEEQLKTLAEHATGGQENAVRQHEKDLEKNRENLEKALAGAEKTPTVDALKPASEQLQKSVESAATAMQSVKQNLAQKADKAREWLQNEVGRPTDVVAKLERELEKDRDRDKSAPADPDHIEAAAAQLKDRAELEEKRPNADAQFVADTAKVADALKALEQAANPSVTNTLAALKAIEKNFRKLEAGHDVAELAPALRQLAGQERWEKPDAAEAGSRARDYEWAKDKMKDLPGRMDLAQLPKEAVKALREAEHSKEAKQVAKEMNERASHPDKETNMSEPLHGMADDTAKVKQQLQPAMEEARAEIEKAAPKLSERLEGLAKTAEKMEQSTTDKADLAGKAEHAEHVNKEAAKLAEAQQKLDSRIEDVKDALRRDANVQDLATDAGRERARDADDAAAMLREQTPATGDLLQQAATTAQPEKQKDALKEAARQEAKLADHLKKLAEHYKGLENGSPADTREALRDAEKETGLKSTLDAEYAKAQALESLAGKSPEAQMAELEKALKSNETMRHELGEIAKNALADAATDMKQAADKEQKAAADLGQAAKSEPQQKGSAEQQAKQIADKAKALAQSIPGIEKKSDQAGLNNKPELNNAAEALTAAARDMPGDFAQPPDKMAAAMDAEASKLQQAAGELNNAANKAGQPANDAQKAAQQQARQAGEKAGALAKQAKELANELSQVHAAAEQQPGIEQAVREAGNEIERAGRHEARLGRENMGQQLQDLGKKVESQTAGQLDNAEKALDQARLPSQAQPVAEDARDAIQKPLEQLESAMKQIPPQVPTSPPEASANQLNSVPEEASKWMARALDSLDSTMNPATPGADKSQDQPAGQPQNRQGQQAKDQKSQGQPSQPTAQQPATRQPSNQQPDNQQPSNQELSRAVQSAAQAQEEAMKEARSSDLLPGEKPLSENGGQRGGGNRKRPLPEGQARIVDSVIIRGEWGKLPPKLARDLLDSQREGVSGEYREMVNLYFKAIADKAKEQKK